MKGRTSVYKKGQYRQWPEDEGPIVLGMTGSSLKRKKQVPRPLQEVAWGRKNKCLKYERQWPGARGKSVFWVRRDKCILGKEGQVYSHQPKSLL